MHTQQARNNFRSALLLCLFPCLLVLAALLFSMLLGFFLGDAWRNIAHWVKRIFLCLCPLMLFGVAIWFMLHPRQIRGNFLWIPCLTIILAFLASVVLGFFVSLVNIDIWEKSLPIFWKLAPHLLVAVMVWFTVAYFLNTAIIRKATGAHPLERRENKRVYNLVENLCISQGMAIPKINLIEDNSLNAFASGIDNHSYTVSLSRGIIDKLNDEELEGVIAHELSHIRNGDTRLLIVSVVFVGLFATVRRLAFHGLYGLRRARDPRMIVIILVVMLAATISYIFSSLMHFALSRSREYLADASAAEMTHRPQALASALRQISQRSNMEKAKKDMFFDVAPLFIEDPDKEPPSGGEQSEEQDKEKDFFDLFDKFTALFATHPPIEKRIAILEQF
ncbi:MAG: M48 family metallopeptidase [Syntrophobacterales bacterium]|nr:M48 family metallopeptidase [Syntrophobacterales bacterium]